MREGSSLARTRITENPVDAARSSASFDHYRRLPPQAAETDDAQKSMVSLWHERMVSGDRRIVCHRSSQAEDRCRRCGCRGRDLSDGQRKDRDGFGSQALALTGELGLTASSAATKMLTHYRRKVRANRRRLAKR